MEETGGGTTQGGAEQSGGVNIEARNSTLTVQGHIVGGNLTIQEAERKLPPPRQIPAPPADFTGREREISALLEWLETRRGRLSGVQGMGGVGKSALAFEVVRRLGDAYPDGHLFVPLAGMSGQPLSPSAAMAQVIRAWHPTDRLPEDVGALTGLYRTMLGGRRILLLLDDAAGTEQVEPLLPPAGWLGALLLTMRIEFYLPGLHALHLDAMPRADAVALLRQSVPRLTDAEADRLAALCGDLPLALRVAGSHLATRRDLTPAAYLRRLGDARQRLAWVEATLSLSYAMLDAAQQRRWRALALFPATFDAAAAAAVWDESDLDASTDALSALVFLSLVEWEEPAEGAEEGRYHLHDLARLFADARLPDDERTPAAARHAAHYGALLAQAKERYRQGNVLDGLRLFDRERANIEAGQAWAAQRAATDDAAARLCSEYPLAGASVLPLRQPPRERMRWLEAALAAARRLGDRAAESAHLVSLGLAYSNAGEGLRAIPYHEQALVIQRGIGDRRGEATALGYLGVVYRYLGEVRRAIGYHEQALVIRREIGDRWGEEADLGNLGAAHAALGETRRAISFFEQALVIARELGDRRGEGNALGSQGFAYYALGEVQRAIPFYEQALVIGREIGDRRGEGDALGCLGLAYHALGEVRRAIPFYEQRLVIARELGNRHAEGTELGNLGRAYAELGEVQRAVPYHEQHLAIAREIGDKPGEGRALGDLGRAYAELGEVRRAIEFYEQHLVIVREIGDRRGEAAELGNLGVAYKNLGEVRRAIEFHEQQLVIVREIGDRRGEGTALGSLGVAYKNLGELGRAIEFYEQQLVIVREIGDRRGEGRALGNQGRAYAELGEAARAIEFYEQQLVIVRASGDRRGEGNALGNLGDAYAELGKVQRAIAFYEQALLVDREIGDRRGEGADLWGMALALDSLGKRAEAVGQAQAALAIFEQIESPQAAKVRAKLAEWGTAEGEKGRGGEGETTANG